MSKITESIGKEIISKYNNGIKVKDIVKEYNISQQTINRYLKSQNISKIKYRSCRRFDKNKENQIIELYKKGYSQKEIAILYNTFNTSIRRVLLRNNIILRGSSNIIRLCKHNPFKKNDEYSDYFLGLLVTDGGMTKEKDSSRNYGINLSLSEVDSYMIELFRNWASPNSKITKTYQKINGSYMYSVTITNKEAEEWLRRKANFYRKSYEAKLYIPLNWNILRGIFDGDGGFLQHNKNSLEFMICSASYTFIQQIYYFLVKNNINPKFRIRKKSNKSVYYIYVYKQDDVIKIGKLMYNNAHIYLNRKYEKWLAFYESKRANGVNSRKEMAIQP